MTRCQRIAVAGLLGIGCVAGSAIRAAADDTCFYRGSMFSHGALSCQNETQFKCDDGEWEAMGVACRPAEVVASRPCAFDGISYTTGSASCQAGTQFRCEDGTWRSLVTPCNVLSANTLKVPSSGDTCMYEDATVANGSTICKSKTTFLCNNGQWVNLGTLCR